jgi:hypothetical protein
VWVDGARMPLGHDFQSNQRSRRWEDSRACTPYADQQQASWYDWVNQSMYCTSLGEPAVHLACAASWAGLCGNGSLLCSLLRHIHSYIHAD